MNIARTETLIINQDINKYPCISFIKQNHPRIMRSINDHGIYLYAEKEAEDSYKDICDITFHLSLSIGNIEPDRFGVGYYEFDKKTYEKDIKNVLYGDAFADYILKKTINHYAKFHLQMPAPFIDAEERKYEPSFDEKIPFSYIEEGLAHSIIRKLWKYAKKGDVFRTWDDIVNDTELSEEEFYTIMTTCE